MVKPEYLSWSVVLNSNSKTGDMSASTKTFPYPSEGRAVSFTVVWTGTPTGTITLEVSGDHDPTDQTNPHNGTWDAVTLSPPIPAVAGAAGQLNLSPEPIRGKWWRVAWAFSAGTGSIRAAADKER